MDKVEVTEADVAIADRANLVWANACGGPSTATIAAALSRITTEAATRAKVEGEIVAWLLKDDTRLRYEESAPEAEREHFSWWAADAITQGTYK